MCRNLHVYSSIGNRQAGVSKGSVLRPLFFLLYVNKVADNIVSLSRLYADDNSLQQCSDICLIEQKLNNDL
jgi:hypothetical protein